MVAVPADRVHRLGYLRDIPDLVCHSSNNIVWVSSVSSSEIVVNAIASLPGNHYQWDADGQITPLGKYLPTRHLSRSPSLWKPLSDWLTIRLPAAKWPATEIEKAKLQLVPSGSVMPGRAVLTSNQALSEFVGAVPVSRFADLKFAATATGQALVCGKSLPPVPGPRFWMAGSVAVPLGMSWSPAIDQTTLQRVFKCATQTIIWLASDQWQAIPNSSFTAVNRTAVRATASANGPAVDEEK